MDRPGDNSKRRPTMSDVARAAGVSPMTVSYAYSQPDRVSAEAAAKVRAAARQLSYPGPHPAARSLRRGRVGSLGVVLGERLSYAFEDPQAARFLAGVSDVCAAEGVGLTLVPITGAPSDAQRVAQAAVDGFVVWTTSDDDPVLEAVADTGLPAVIHAGPYRPGIPVIGIDDRAAATAIGEVAFTRARCPVVLGFPLDRGRTRQLLTGDEVAEVRFPVTRRRWEGFRDAWTAGGHPAARLRLAVCPLNHITEGESFALELLRGAEPPDAIAAMSDELALGALRAAAHLGLRVPDDVAITGWDDRDIAEPAGLTTLAQSLREQGADCARTALGLPTAGQARHEWEVVVRTTTRRPR
ncbi:MULTISPECIES: LacI family DNA-binding transcriptional regulator [unclassified Micromonospora]|uniref:LacI family DNA-binding transcriptional regulator n=1 Tax=unclassified Micromonospora TaxID=2617518 RepID=UPI001B37FD73|nr:MULTISPECIES: LacI family DNA-binding transcriptional regulator [unclassified Micromonospora]MBQ1044360.1 LacI family DNA-binding transcriptional regulator [Micromonospora sp. C72]MBQ1056864.1 LacI family DNA-binding transcriptional regulator [Micromonospora sp. C32]